MRFYEMPLGMFGWGDNDIGVFGGTRSDGFHPKDHLWCDFFIYDTAHKMETGEDRKVGYMKLLIKFNNTAFYEPEIKKLLKMEIDESLRRDPRKKQAGQGLGRRAIAGLQRMITEDIEILDIQPKAKGFWQKVGVEPVSKERKIDGVLKARGWEAIFSLDATAHRYTGPITSDFQEIAAEADLQEMLKGAKVMFKNTDGEVAERWLVTKAGQFLRQAGSEFEQSHLVDAAIVRDHCEGKINAKLEARLVDLNLLPTRQHLLATAI